MAKARHQDLTLTDPVPVDTSYPPFGRIKESWRVSIADGDDPTLKRQASVDAPDPPGHQDLTLTEPAPVDTSDSPVTRTNETFKIHIESKAAMSAIVVLSVAIVAHFVLGLNGIAALGAGLAVTVAVSYPRYATKIIQWMSSWTGKFKAK